MGQLIMPMWVCDACGWTWARTPGAKPERCPSPKCRSRQWDGGREAPKTPAEAPEPAVDMEHLREIAAGRNLTLADLPVNKLVVPERWPWDEQPPKKPVQPELPENSFIGGADEMADGIMSGAEIKMCGYTEFDGQTGEIIHCGLPEHGPKVRHGNQWRESA